MPYADKLEYELYQEQYRKKHRKENILYASEYRSKHREEWKKNRVEQLRRYNITIVEYNDMFNKQNGCCAICGTHQSILKQRLSVDHCHKTNKNRDLLCQKCNTAIGMLSDSIELLRKCITYLKNHEEKNK